MTLVDDIVEVRPDLKRRARFLTRDRSRADDLVQDTLVRALSHLDQFCPGSNLKAWLLTIMRNSYIKSRRRASFISIDGDDATSSYEIPTPDNAARSVEFDELYRALSMLSPDHRCVLLLVAYDDVSYEEAAEILGIPEGTVKSRTFRAREHLARLLDSA